MEPKASKAAILTFDFLEIKGSKIALPNNSVKCKSISLLFLQNAEIVKQASLYISPLGSMAKVLKILETSSRY